MTPQFELTQSLPRDGDHVLMSEVFSQMFQDNCATLELKLTLMTVTYVMIGKCYLCHDTEHFALPPFPTCSNLTG